MRVGSAETGTNTRLFIGKGVVGRWLDVRLNYVQSCSDPLSFNDQKGPGSLVFWVLSSFQ